MLSYLNVKFLVLLAIMSWILLCIITPEQKSDCKNEPTLSEDIFKWCMNLFLTIYKMGQNLAVCVIIILLGVLILIKSVARQVKGFVVAAVSNERYSNLQISYLKEEKFMLLRSLKQQKQEIKMHEQQINFNSALIQNLKAEQWLMKEKYERVKKKCFSYSTENNNITEESSNTSPSSHNKSKESGTNSSCIKGKRDNEYFNNQVFSLNNKNLVSHSIKESGSSSRYISSNYLQCEEDTACTHVLKARCNINIVSTEQLQKIKGNTHPKFLPNFK